MPSIEKNHDLDLPAWGPYSKELAGTSHIPDISAGLRFDVAVVPGYFRQAMIVPNEKFASGHHAWEAAADLSYYSFRYEIEWKDQVYCDVSYSQVSDQARLIRCNFVNNTEIHQNLMMHLLANMNFPPLRPDVHGTLQTEHCITPSRVTLPDNGIWVDALDYKDLQFATPRPTDNLVVDGWVRAEFRDHGFVDGVGIGEDFGIDAGDRVDFVFDVDAGIEDAVLTLRYRLREEQRVSFNVEGIADTTIVCEAVNADDYGFSLLRINLGKIEAGKNQLTLHSLGGAAIEVDGFAITAKSEVKELDFAFHEWTPEPQQIEGPHAKSVLLKYPDCDIYYGLAWDHPNVWFREFKTDNLNTQLRFMVPNNYTGLIDDGGSRHYTDVFLRPIELKPNTERTHYAVVCSGSREEVEKILNEFAQEFATELELIYDNARQNYLHMKPLPAGDTYRFSQERMAATELLNIVYPVYTRRQYIRHFCPGKWWDSLYTWDSGFIGLALLEYDTALSARNLDTYLTEPGDEHAAFINHGSLIPTQIYQFKEIWNRTQDRAMLASFYPKLKQYYLFLAGRLGNSTTRDLKSNLIRTWEIFRWDSGGWDDYPAQMNTIENDLDPKVTCAAVTAHVIRAAKVLRESAQALGLEEDIAEYEDDIAVLGNALQEHAWDEEAGYFSYVVHDDAGEPIAHMRDEDGVNFNMGLDGIMPIFAGICTPEQETLFLERLADPDRYWTRIGLSTVDQSAPYYRTDGYWNGAVWMPHQWFMWKTALDLGKGDFAYQIAKTALNLWKAEVEASYYCFEHFLIESGSGAGWHQFGALSSPVVSWYSAYYRSGVLSTGMDIWVEEQNFSKTFDAFNGKFKLNAAPKTVTVIINLQAGPTYNVNWNGQTLAYKERHSGSLEIELPFDSQHGTLEVAPN